MEKERAIQRRITRLRSAHLVFRLIVVLEYGETSLSRAIFLSLRLDQLWSVAHDGLKFTPIGRKNIDRGEFPDSIQPPVVFSGEARLGKGDLIGGHLVPTRSECRK